MANKYADQSKAEEKMAERLLRMHSIRVDFGSIWLVPETTWDRCATWYRENHDRKVHPGLSLNGDRRYDVSLEAAPMLFGRTKSGGRFSFKVLNVTPQHHTFFLCRRYALIPRDEFVAEKQNAISTCISRNPTKPSLTVEETRDLRVKLKETQPRL